MQRGYDARLFVVDGHILFFLKREPAIAFQDMSQALDSESAGSLDKCSASTRHDIPLRGTFTFRAFL